MFQITVYGIPGSPFLRTVEIVLKEKEVPYQLHALAPGEHKSEEYLKRHPFGRVPAFEQGDFALYETQAIIRYLDDSFAHPRLTPAIPQERARMNQIIGIIEWYFFPKAAAPIGFNRIIGPILLGLAPNEEAIVEALPVARTSIATLDAFLGTKPYLTGDSVSLADMMLGAQLDIFRLCREGEDLLKGTALEEWLGRMTSRSSFLETQPPEKLRTPSLAA